MGRKRTAPPPTLWSICPSHLQNCGHQGAKRCQGLSDVCPWKGCGKERGPFGAQVCVCNFLPVRKHSAQISSASPFPALAPQEEVAASRGPRWPQPDFPAELGRSDALDCPALCSR